MSDLPTIISDDYDMAPSSSTIPYPFCPSTRLIFATMVALGAFTIYAQRVCLSISLVAMVEWHPEMDPGADTDLAAMNTTNTTTTESDKRHWDSRIQGSVLASFFYGYIFTQIPGGFLTRRFGGRIIFAAGVFASTLFTLASPLAAKTHWRLLWAARFLAGFGQGLVFPTVNGMYSLWVPPAERSFMIAFLEVGVLLGVIIPLPVAGVICDSIGWELVFYLLGGVGLVWTFAWLFLITDSPSSHRRIDEAEKKYIEASLEREGGKGISGSNRGLLDYPWLHILFSPATLAIYAAHVSFNWTYFIFLTSTPKFLRDVFQYDMKSNGILSALPYVAYLIVALLVGKAADRMTQRWMTTAATRKLFNSLSLGLRTLSLLLLSLFIHSPSFSVALVICATGFGGFVCSGFLVNPLDIAPQFAGVVFGVSNTLAAFPGFAGPEMMGALTSAFPPTEAWRYVFLISAGIEACGLIVFACLSSGQVQPWAKTPPEHQAVCASPWAGCREGCRAVRAEEDEGGMVAL